MVIKAVTTLPLLFTLSRGLKHYGPDPTAYHPSDIDPLGWSPRPTEGPEYPFGDLRARRLFNKRDLTNTCAYLEGYPLGCPPNQYCAYNSVLSYMGCCSVDSNGNFLSDCVLTTSCVDQAASLSLEESLCPTTTIDVLCPFGPATGVW